MSRDALLLFGIVFALFAMQAIGGFFQIRDYKKTIRRVHKLGNVGFGQKKGRFFNGHLVLLACDSKRIITGCEVLDGKTFISKFHPIDTLLGKPLVGVSIDEFLQDFRAMAEKKQKQYRGYIQALEALELRFEQESSETELLATAGQQTVGENT